MDEFVRIVSGVFAKQLKGIFKPTLWRLFAYSSMWVAINRSFTIHIDARVVVNDIVRRNIKFIRAKYPFLDNNAVGEN